MKKVVTSTFKALLTVIVILISSFHFTASAQTSTLQSRISVVSNETKTNIWVSDFPKKTNVVLMDSENNLLSIISTNDYGAAFISLPSTVKTAVIAKTLNGEIMVSNKVIYKGGKAENNVSSTETAVVDKTIAKA